MPATVPPRIDSGAAIRLHRFLVLALAAAALVTCTGEPTSPARPGVGTLRVTPHFDAFARLVPLTLDNVRVIVVRPPSDVILTATRSFNPSTQQLTLSLPVLLQSTSEALQVTLELYAGTTLLFSGTSTVQVAAGGTTAPASVPVVYQGPGATLTTLTLAPRDTTVSLGASFPFTATAQDAQQANVPQFYVSWSADNGSIDAAGMFTAPGVRDTVMVHGVTPNGVEDSTRVIVTAAPSTLTRVGGDGQSGIVGTRLAQPLAVQVTGTDGQPVAGAVVAFTVTTGGGSVDSAVATSDAQGIARSGAVLGLTVGQQTFTASVSGIPATVFTATATGVAPIVVTLAAGGNHTCEIRGTQTLCWGDNSSGQLGDGTTTDRAVPGPVATAQTFVSLALGDGHTCALTAAGQAFCWGENFSGSLGDGTTTGSPTPVAVSGGRTFVALSAGEEFTCGLTAAGQAFCWGYNFDGQLGDGTNTDRLIPTAVTGGLSFTGLDAGTDHACALTAAGLAFCWGSNFDGQLGDGTLVSQNVPTAVTGGLSFSALHAGFNFSCGLDTSGAGFCWGINFGIQLTSPQPVAGGFTYTAIAGGDNHICGLTTGGWRCGGDNGSGQLGDGTTTDRVSPVLASGGFTFSALAGGSQHTCGRTSSGTRCWGSNTVGQLGDGSTTDQLTPTLTVGPATIAAVSAGNSQTASAGTAVPIAPAIVVRDALNNPVPGLDVIFAVTSGGGSVTGALTQTDALGIATVGSWTLGATPGTNTLSATVQVGGVSGNPVSFTATGTTVGGLTWNGSVSTDWNTAANWTPAQVPTSADDVMIPSGPTNQPTLTTTGNMRSLTIQGTLTLAGSFTFNVFGDFDNSGGLVVSGTPAIDLRGTGRTLRGNSSAITSVSGSYTLNGSVTVANALSISGGTASLTVGGQLLSVSTLSVGSGGSLVMTNPADVVVVSGNLTMGGGDHTGKLTAGQIQVQGNFLQSGTPNSFVATGTHTTILTSFGSVTFQNPGTTASRFQHLAVIAGPSVLQSRVVAGGDVSVSGMLTLNGRTLEVLGDFAVQVVASRLTMANALDSLLVGGNATFAGGSELTFMSAGVLVVGGNLTQQSTISPDAFHPSGTHKTVLTGANPTLSFASPGNVPGTSHFETVEWTGTGTLTLGTNVFAHGAFQSLGAGASSIASINAVLDVGGFAAAGPMTFNGTLLRLNMPSGGPLALGNLTFQNMSSTVNQLEVLHPGTGGPFTFSNFTFSSVPTSGRYLLATDTDGGTPASLTIDMVNPAPATDGGFSQALNGAVINWPASGPIKTWLGTTQDWHTTTNWSPAGVPTATDDVTIPVTANQPILSANAVARTVTINAGVLVNLNSFDLDVHGDLIGLASPSFISGGGTVQLLGTARTAQGILGSAQQVTVQGSYSLSGPTAMQDLNILGTGTLTVNGQTLTISNAMFVSGAGARLIMNNPADVVSVATSAFFDGAASGGSLTAGVLRVGGNFTAAANFSSSAFDPSLAHRVILTTPNINQSVNFGSIASHFQDLELVPLGGMSMVSSVSVTGRLITTGGVAQSPGVSGVSTTLTVAGVDVDGLVVNQAPMTIGNGTITRFQNVVFSGQLSTITQLTVNNPGGATPFAFTNVSFTNTPTSGGLYLSATDSDGATPNVLTLDLVNPSPATPGGFTLTDGIAVINWPATAPVVQWTGAFNANWHQPLNWSTGSVPTVLDDVTIPFGTPVTPILFGPAVSGSLTVQASTILDLGGFPLTVNGNLDATGSGVTGAAGSMLTMAGTNFGMQGSVGVDVTISGNTLLSSSFGLTGSLLLDATLNLNGFDLSVGGDFTSTGFLVMQSPADLLSVAGNATFDGLNELGFMTAGTTSFGGNFTQLNSNSDDSFHPSGTHTTILSGSNPTISFATPGDTPGSSHFQEVFWTPTGGTLTLLTDVFAHGMFGGAGSVNGTITSSNGRTLHAGGFFSASTVFDNVQLVLHQPSATIIDLQNVTFQNINPLAVALTTEHNGVPSASPLTYTNISFNYTPTAGGFYLRATDLAVDGNPLFIDMVNPVPSTPGPFVDVVNGATVLWPASSPTITWNGSVDSDWFNTANWNGGVVPGSFDNVIIGAGANQPVLTNSTGINDLTVQAGASVEIADFVLVMNGNVDVAGSIQDLTGTGNGGVTVTGSGTTLQGTMNTTVAVAGSSTMNGNLITGDLSLSGSLSVGANFLDVQGVLATIGGGTLAMNHVSGQVQVSGDAVFNGGSTSGLLTAGTLTIGGDFIQVGTNSAQSFAADPGHVTVLSGNPVNITFTTPGANASHFGDLRESGFGATFNLGSNVTVLGALSGGDGFGGTMVGTSCPVVLTVGNYFTSGPLNLDCVQLVVDDPAGVNTFFGGISFTNMPTDVTQLTIQHPGVSAGNLDLGFMSFVQLNTGDTGFYVAAVETTPGAPPLVVNLVTQGTNVTNGASFTTTSGGASVLWP